MSEPGWYPDPAGTPDVLRYWDGQQWSEQTMSWPPLPPQAPSAAEAPPVEPVEPAEPAEPADDASDPGWPSEQTGPTEPTEPTQPIAASPYAPSPYAPPPGPVPPSPYGQDRPAQPGEPTYGALPSSSPFGQTAFGQVPPTPTPYGQPGPGQFGPGPFDAPISIGPRRGAGLGARTIALIAVAVIAMIALIGVGALVAVRSLASIDGEDSATAGPASQTPDGRVAPADLCTGGVPVGGTAPDPATGALSGGGLTMPAPAGYTFDPRAAAPLEFGDDVTAVVQPVDPTWISEYALGSLTRANGFDDAKGAANAVMECLLANPSVYVDVTDREDLSAEPVTIDGKAGFRLTTKITVAARPGSTIEGDVTTVIVVDTGDADAFGFYLGVVPIGDDARLAASEKQVSSLAVAGP